MATPAASKKRIAGSRASSRTASLCLLPTREEFERRCPSIVREYQGVGYLDDNPVLFERTSNKKVYPCVYFGVCLSSVQARRPNMPAGILTKAVD